MKLYLISLFVGVLIGEIYGFINVRSPAPPVIVLVGLVGIRARVQRYAASNSGDAVNH
jgi:XapX domain-containing protein